jgi:hypothetical protein
MTQLEDATRRALRAHAGEVQPPLPPLDLGRRRASGASGRLVFGPWLSGQLRWLGPAAAVITVLALAATALVSRGADQGRSSQRAAMIETTVPPYYVALVSKTPPASSNITTVQTVATVRLTATGSEVASVAPPAPYTTFLSVSGATGDRTFVLLAVRPALRAGAARPERFYLLHIDPQAASAADRTQLTALPAADIPASKQASTMTLAPNGASLAALLNSNSTNASALYIYNLQTRSIRIWTKTDCGGSPCLPGIMGLPFPSFYLGAPTSTLFHYPPELSWTQDSQSLAFVPGGFGPGDTQLRLLRIDAPGSNLEADSTAIRGLHTPGSNIPHSIIAIYSWSSAVLTPDRKTVFVGYTWLHGGSVSYSLARFSRVTRKLTNLYTVPIDHDKPIPPGQHPEGEGIDEVVWTSYDGSEAVVLDIGAGHSAGIFTGSRYTPLPWPSNAVDAAW